MNIVTYCGKISVPTWVAMQPFQNQYGGGSRSVTASDAKGSPLAEQRAMWKEEVGDDEDASDDVVCEHR